MSVPDKIKPARLVRNRESKKVISGSISADRLETIADVVQEYKIADGIEVELLFHSNESGQVVLEGGLQTELNVVCQRCLQGMQYPLNSEFSLTLVSGDEQEASDQETLAVDEDGELDVLQLISDELVMALPVAAVHPIGSECHSIEFVGEDEGFEPERENPFSILKQLKS